MQVLMSLYTIFPCYTVFLNKIQYRLPLLRRISVIKQFTWLVTLRIFPTPTPLNKVLIISQWSPERELCRSAVFGKSLLLFHNDFSSHFNTLLPSRHAVIWRPKSTPCSTSRIYKPSLPTAHTFQQRQCVWKPMAQASNLWGCRERN